MSLGGLAGGWAGYAGGGGLRRLDVPLVALFAKPPDGAGAANSIGRDFNNQTATDLVGVLARGVETGAAIEGFGERVIDRKTRTFDGIKAGELRLCCCHSYKL